MADLTALALQSAVSISASELHGLVCGLGVCGVRGSLVQHLLNLAGADALTDQDSVEAFVNTTMAELTSEGLSFMPLLPDDQVELASRVEALAQWCAGFLTGFGAGLAELGVESIDDLPVEVGEIVGDLVAISEVDHGDQDANVDAGGSAEHDLMQVEEFVKVGVLLMLSLLQREQE